MNAGAHGRCVRIFRGAVMRKGDEAVAPLFLDRPPTIFRPQRQRATSMQPSRRPLWLHEPNQMASGVTGEVNESLKGVMGMIWGRAPIYFRVSLQTWVCQSRSHRHM
jgi:hypothetical protein